MPTTPCKRCDVEAVWAHTRAGTKMFVDAEPSPKGMIRLELSPDGKSVVAMLILVRPPPPGPLYESHFATCAAEDTTLTRRKRKAKS